MAVKVQFSMRGLILVTTSAAIAVAAISARNSLASVAVTELVAIYFLAASALACADAQGSARGFWLGFTTCTGLGAVFYTSCLPYSIVCAVDVPSKPAFALDVADVSRQVLPALWCASPAVGILCSLQRWFLLRGLEK